MNNHYHLVIETPVGNLSKGRAVKLHNSIENRLIKSLTEQQG